MNNDEKHVDQIRRNLLNAIDAAMETHEALIPDHDKYEAFLEDLVPSTEGFRVDKEKLQRFRVRTPTFANIPPLVHMLKGCDFADVPVIVLTIDPCISCTER